MRSPPADLAWDHLAEALYRGWGVQVESMDYVPEGGGSHHWAVTDCSGRHHFVTVDDLGTKDWLGDTFDAAFDGLRRSLVTALALRSAAGLEFVVAPVPALDGEVLRRLDQRYSVSVFPYLAGRSYPFGPYPDAELRDQHDRSAGRAAPVHAGRSQPGAQPRPQFRGPRPAGSVRGRS